MNQIYMWDKMKILIVLLVYISKIAIAAETRGIQDDPCRFIDQFRVSVSDYGGLCKYERLNLALKPASNKRVIYFGDSITEWWGSDIPGIDQSDTLNRGYKGQTTDQMLLRFRADVINLKPKIVHIMAGTNDIAGNNGPTSLQRIKDNINSMCELASKNNIQVILGSLLPIVKLHWAPNIKPSEHILVINTWIKEYARKNGHEFLDYYSIFKQEEFISKYSHDGVHPNKDGYTVMKKLAQKGMLRVSSKN